MVFDFKIVEGLALSSMTSTIRDSLTGVECVTYEHKETHDGALLLPFESLEELCSAKGITAPKIPAMLSRRLTTGAKYAVQLSSCFSEQKIDAVVFSSRHGELKRNEKILLNIAKDEAVSPTDFSMSVHNVAVSQFLIAQHLRVPYSSVAAGANTFVQSLYEIEAFLLAGYQNILYVDFDSQIPDVFSAHITNDVLSLSYATAFLIKRGGHFELQSSSCNHSNGLATNCPQSLLFYGAWALGRERIKLASSNYSVSLIRDGNGK